MLGEPAIPVGEGRVGRRGHLEPIYLAGRDPESISHTRRVRLRGDLDKLAVSGDDGGGVELDDEEDVVCAGLDGVHAIIDPKPFDRRP